MGTCRRAMGRPRAGNARAAFGLLLLAGMGCGGGGSEGLDPSTCTVLPTALATKPSTGDRVLIETRFLVVDASHAGSLGLNLDLLLPVEAGASQGDEGTPAHGQAVLAWPEAIGGAAGTPSLVPAAPPAGSVLPTFFPQGTQPSSPFSPFVGVPGPGCILFAPAFHLPVAGTLLQAGPPLAPESGPHSHSLAATLLGSPALDALLQQVGAGAGNQVLAAPAATLYDGQILALLLRNQIASLQELEPGMAAAVSPLGPPQGLVWTGPALRLFARIQPGRDGVALDLLLGGRIVIALPPDPVVVGGSSGGAEVPVERRSGARTRVVVPDGQTVVLGGVVEAPGGPVVPDLPDLRKLPVLGQLFRSPVHLQETDRLLVLVTPRILDATD